MHPTLHTLWQGMDLLVMRDAREIDRIAAAEIERVILVCQRGGDTPGDLAFALVETADDFVLLPPASGIAGRVHFERQAFWAEQACVYWVPQQSMAPLPSGLRGGWAFWRSATPVYRRVPRAELAEAVQAWPLEGPQSWEQRKWQRIVRSRLLQPWQAASSSRQSR
jgi:hypothetical protein